MLVKIDWNKTPLVPAVAQDAESKEVLMLAYMNEEAYRLSLETGYAHYFSRSRQRIWKKGESSGHTQRIVDLRIDCDGDTILLLVEQKGVACHTGRKSCFFTSVTRGEETQAPSVDPGAVYGVVETLYHTILERRNDTSGKSWTKKLLDDPVLLQSKIREEADELATAIAEESDAQVIYEAADLLYHSLVGLASRDITPDRVRQELARRFGVSGIEEKASRKK